MCGYVPPIPRVSTLLPSLLSTEGDSYTLWPLTSKGPGVEERIIAVQC